MYNERCKSVKVQHEQRQVMIHSCNVRFVLIKPMLMIRLAGLIMDFVVLSRDGRYGLKTISRYFLVFIALTMSFMI